MAIKKFPTWATTPTTVSNGDPSLEEPSTGLFTDGWDIVKPLVQHFNWLFNSIGYFVKANNEVKTVTNGYEAEVGETVEINNSTANVTGLLPASPIDMQRVTMGGTSNLTSFTVTILGNGKDIMEVGVDAVVLDIRYRHYTFVWDETAGLWIIGLGDLQGAIQ